MEQVGDGQEYGETKDGTADEADDLDHEASRSSSAAAACNW